MNSAGAKARWLLRTVVSAVCVGVVTVGTTPSASAGANGCNHRTCISVEGSGLRVETVSASTTWNGDFTGHFHIWGGGIDRNSPTQFWGYHQKFSVPVHRDLPNRAVLCAEGWEHVNGRLESRGRACEEVRF
ncbi:hypothetical protein [Streptomyces albireticuli]|uniref:Uncharacterized protein n=1 Tax=Streptomyces albireticuli TaxID=1940 RepID=A0A2A2DFD4_9ACTN|nr:hypothetical protein [Streptomyces albireticuli]MCD9194754.1 hypothetical protein [Streptomyces albireticuli]PAU49982.1 hypothetical protein CK936_04840 [Streptomyces albireticuli]